MGDEVGLTISFDITNTVKVDGDEVPEVYLGALNKPPKDISFALKALVAYDSVNISAVKTLSGKLQIPHRQLQYWLNNGFTTAMITLKIYVRSSEHYMELSDKIDITK